ncbi:Serine/threonine-protein kinase RIO2 [Cyberlindnera fabianii]|uniref:Serine/threonine-protein kinase RIO2 n=1 Tax=Cyberlindnera fabianii TaxID=36022 RepID=A0A1V2LBK9_CYBFA|nr:Serine/threonine-protein kinase RIO2 [Cyberlindnera fabianii]
MKLDTSHMRYLTLDDFRVLTAVEMGSRNHEVVPTTLIHQIGGLRSQSGTNRCISDLAKLKLISRLRNAKYDGYRLTHTGFDYLAIKSMLNRKSVYSIGTTIGVGKESDIYSVSDNTGIKKVLKIHRLGRTSFRTVKNNRDYLRNRSSGSWMYLSRLAANKEFQFMDTLYTNGFSVPQPFDYSRHCVLMQHIDGFPMKALRKHANKKKLYSDLMKFIVNLANHGLIHCDFNEFNIIIVNDEAKGNYRDDFIVIDFPQCISTQHVDAEFYFNRDVECIRRFFRKKLGYNPVAESGMLDTDGYGEGYKYMFPDFHRDVERIADLDVQVEASGYSKKKKGDRDLEDAVASMRAGDETEYEEENGNASDDEGEENDEDEDEDEYDYDSYQSDEESSGDEDSEEEDEENERIIKALQDGVKELKMDKLGNYIIDDEE